MTRMHKSYVAGAVLLALVACDGADGVLANPASQFGGQFLTAFTAAPTATPAPRAQLVVSFGGTQGVSTTAAPVDL